jgi:hypothetical protein
MVGPWRTLRSTPTSQAHLWQGRDQMIDMLTEPITGASVWRGDDLADPDRWTIQLGEEDFADFDRALAHVSKLRVAHLTDLRAGDFRLAAFADRIADVVNRLEHGPGLVLLWISCPETGRPLCPEYAAWRNGYPTSATRA